MSKIGIEIANQILKEQDSNNPDDKKSVVGGAASGAVKGAGLAAGIWGAGAAMGGKASSGPMAKKRGGLLDVFRSKSGPMPDQGSILTGKVVKPIGIMGRDARDASGKIFKPGARAGVYASRLGTTLRKVPMGKLAGAGAVIGGTAAYLHNKKNQQG